jgi:hypothetical protein
MVRIKILEWVTVLAGMISVGVFISFGIFCSCTGNTKDTANTDDMEQASLQKMFSMNMTPDSLRTAEEKALIQKMEALFYEDVTIENGRMKTNLGKEDFRKRGIPEGYYDAIKKDMADINNYLDTTSVFWRNLTIEAFQKSKAEYFARKDSLHKE